MSKACLILALIALLSATCAQCLAGASARGNPSEVFEYLKKQLGGGALELSRGNASRSDRFYCVVECFVMAGAIRAKAFDIAVARDGDRTAALVRYADGLPYCYLTDGMAVLLDREQGTPCLRVFKGGAPHFVLRADAGGFRFDLSHRDLKKEREFVLDVASVVDQITRANDAFYDSGMQTVRFATEKGFVSVRLAVKQPQNPYPLESIVVQGKTGNEIGVSCFDLSKTPPLDLFRVDDKRLKALPIQIRAMTEEELVKASPFPKQNSPADAQLRAAAVAWETVFAPESPKK